MAKDYLAVMASSAPIERQFSIFGNIITKNRNRIEEEIGRTLMCLRNWKVPELSVSLQYRWFMIMACLPDLQCTNQMRYNSERGTDYLRLDSEDDRPATEPASVK